MRVSSRTSRRLTIALVLSLLRPVMAHASWASDGNRVVDPSAQAAYPVMVPSDSGDVFMAWVDARSGYNTDVRATRWTPRGLAAPGWTASGDLVTALTCTKFELAATPDGAGGAFLAWGDNRCQGYRNVYLGHVTSAGVTATFWPTNGVRCAPTTQDQNLPTVTPDGQGGAFVAWEDTRNGEPDVLLQHVDIDGNVVGTHDGHWRYTVGQRKGLGVAAGEPLYVVATDAARNRVVVGTRADLAAHEIDVDHLVAHEVPAHALDVRIRHHGQSLRGRIVHTGDGTGRVVLEDAAEAVAPGQTAALYDEGRLVAAGTIARAPARVDRTEE